MVSATGLRPIEVWEMTPNFISRLIHNYQTRERQLSQERWELSRWISYINVKIHDSKKKLHSVYSLAKFPWEVSQTIHRKKEEVFTPEETQLLDRIKSIPLQN